MFLVIGLGLFFKKSREITPPNNQLFLYYVFNFLFFRSLLKFVTISCIFLTLKKYVHEAIDLFVLYWNFVFRFNTSYSSIYSFW